MINKALRVRIYPNKTQQKKIDATINCCRFVRNHMIERNRKLYGMFLTMLEYKLRDRGKQLVKIDKWYPSSQTCSCCGHKQKMPLYVRTYDCPQCGNRMDRDYNAAVNIRNEGLRILKEKAA